MHRQVAVALAETSTLARPLRGGERCEQQHAARAQACMHACVRVCACVRARAWGCEVRCAGRRGGERGWCTLGSSAPAGGEARSAPLGTWCQAGEPQQDEGKRGGDAPVSVVFAQQPRRSTPCSDELRRCLRRARTTQEGERGQTSDAVHRV